MPSRKLPFVAKQAARNHCTKHFAKTPCHRLTPPTCPRPAGTGCNTTLTLLMGTEGGQGDGLPSAVEAKMGHPSPSECPHGQDLPAGRQAGGGTWGDGMVLLCMGRAQRGMGRHHSPFRSCLSSWGLSARCRGVVFGDPFPERPAQVLLQGYGRGAHPVSPHPCPSLLPQRKSGPNSTFQ